MKNIRKKRLFFVSLVSIFSLAMLNAKIIRRGIVHEALQEISAPHGNGVVEIHSPEEFDNLLRTKNKVIAQFYNRSCPACKKFEATGIYQNMAQTYPAITFVKVEKDLPELHQNYNIQFYPTIIFFKDGQKVKESVGVIDKKKFDELINQAQLIQQ